jgi:hypothetical protein
MPPKAAAKEFLAGSRNFSGIAVFKRFNHTCIPSTSEDGRSLDTSHDRSIERRDVLPLQTALKKYLKQFVSFCPKNAS